MDLRAEVLAFDPELPIERGSTPPASWYIEPDVHHLERRSVFAQNWGLACRADQVVEPGDFVAGRSLDLPWVVVRGDDGTLRAFANVCRHKATEVCRGAGSAPHFTCPYHGWSYHLDGRLRGAPRVAGIVALDRDALSLPSLGVEVVGPLVFVHPDPAAAPLAPTLTELCTALDATGWQHMRWHSRRTYTMDCNWKVFADNYLDGGYHIAQLHPTLAAQLDLPRYCTELFDRFNIQTCPAATSDDPSLVVPPSERIDAGAIYAWIYPNLMINRYGPCLDINWVAPLSAERCIAIFDFWFAPDLPDADVTRWAEASIAQAEQTQQEDLDISERAQAGMRSGHWHRGRYAPQLETGVHHFHRLLAADLRRALSGGG